MRKAHHVGCALKLIPSRARSSGLALVLCGQLVLATVCFAQVTERVNLGPNGIQSTGIGDLPQAGSFVSADGRYVAFRSSGSNLVAGDTNAAYDIFVRDRQVGTTERVSVDSSGAQANGGSGLFGFTMTPDGRFVAYYSEASNLVVLDGNGVGDTFVRDRLTGATELVSVDSSGAQGNGTSGYPAISPDGRFVVFSSAASNLVTGDTNGRWDVFVHDRWTGATERASIANSGAQGNADAGWASVSADGRFVAFYSGASNLITGDTNGTLDVFVRDRLAGTTELVNVPIGGPQFNMQTWGGSISGDGRYVAFVSAASNLVAGDTNNAWDAFLRDRQLGTTACISANQNGLPGNGTSYPPFLSADGRFASFSSGASDLVPGITNGGIFVRDLRAGTTEYASLSTAGVLPNGACEFSSISAMGRYVVFRADATNLVANDTNNVTDIFLHDRLAGGFTSLCSPGDNNVIACPCNNQPSGTGRGCENSAATGGATLSASGIAYLSLDNLVFTASGETPNATSILLEGSTLLPIGLVFGQGVRCAGGTLKRLFVKTASAGSITAPDFAGGDSTVSARSAALGSQIQPGVPCYFLAYYRDPAVLGSCPATSTFNCTQTGVISWWP